MTIRAILGRLPRQDGELLACAMEAGLTNQFVEYSPGRFVGVNILPALMPRLAVEQTAGAYSAGAILGAASQPPTEGDK